jgi:hypothetical protein
VLASQENDVFLRGDRGCPSLAGPGPAAVARPDEPGLAAEIVFALLLDGLADVTLTGRDSGEVAASLWRFVAGGLRIDTKGTR